MSNVWCCLMKRKLPESNSEDAEKELLLGLGNVIDYDEIPDMIRSTIDRIFPNSHSVKIEWSTNMGSGTSLSESNVWMKKAGTLKENIILKRSEIQQEKYSEYFETDDSDNFGVILPLLDEGNPDFQAYLSFKCKEFDNEDKKLLKSFENQVKVMFQRLKRLNKPIKDASTNGNCSSTLQRSYEYDRDSSILALCASLHDRDPGLLQVKIVDFLKQKIKMDSAFVLTLSYNNLELVCQARDSTIFDPEKRFAVVGSILDVCIKEKRCVHITNVNKDQLAEVQELINIELKSFLCVPIINQSDSTVTALVCLINKVDGDQFNEEDIAVTRHVFHYTAAVLTSSVAFQMERRLKIQTETMLQVAMNIFRKLDDLTVLLKEIMNEAKKLTNAERCSVFLVENDTKELVSKVFDGLPAMSDDSKQPVEIRIPQTQGVAGHVASTGEILNIVDAYNHPLFYRGVDEETGYRTRNILCFPIKDDQDVVVGVAQLCNKLNGPHFTCYDEDIARSFSVYCCISLVHSLMYKKVQDVQHRNKLANELMTYHMKVTEENVTWFTNCKIPILTDIKEGITSFDSLPRDIKDNDSILAVLSMFNDLGFINKYRMSRPTLARFVLMVKRGYRDPPYHNWTHAFSVAHFICLCIINLPLNDQLTQLELLSLFVASLCHDIDHRGTNNSFQVASHSVLADLYSSGGSVLERHHFSQTVCVLNTEGCNIFEHLSPTDYPKVLDLIRDIILATDLAQHIRIIDSQRKMITAPYNSNFAEHHTLLLDLLMTSADLSDQTKNWKNTREVAELIYKEFFNQGDLEKEIGKNPTEQMDRDRACVPNLQLSFLDGIALPCFQLFSDMYPNFGRGILQNIRTNRSNWEKLNEDIKNGKIDSFQLFHGELSPVCSSTKSVVDS